MKKFSVIIILGLVVLVAAAVAPSTMPAKKPLPTITPNLSIMKVAHRGVSAYAPENTLPAIRKAIELGYDYVEMDVCYTRDGVPVLLHDGILNRTTNGFGLVSLYSLSELKKLDAGSWFDEKFRGTQIPTLEEALKVMQGKIKLYLDQKEPARPELIRLLKQYGFYPDNLVVVHGFWSIRSFLHYEPEAPVMPMLRNAGQVKELVERYPSTVVFDSTCEELTREMVAEAHRYGIMVFTDATGQSNSECMRRPIEYGSDAIQFDNADLFFSVIEQMKREAGAAPPSAAENEPDPRIDRLCQESANPDAAPDKIHIHCRLESGSFAPPKAAAGTADKKEIKIAAYNLERGMFLEEQAGVLKHHPAFGDIDILLISEADRGCSRTGYRNVARDLARMLGMNYVYGVEYIELPRKSKRPVDDNETICEHGNAILSPHPILSPELIRHRQTQNWYIPPGPERENREPRLGGCMALAADIEVDGDLIRAYDVHFDSGLGKEISQDRESEAQELVDHAAGIDRTVVMGGDFNTILYTADALTRGKLDSAVQVLYDAGFTDAHQSIPWPKRGTTGMEYGIRGIIDHIYVRGAKVEQSGICSSKRCGRLSDHLPLWATIMPQGHF